MKKLIILAVACTSVAACHAQKISEKEVPALVRTQFGKKFPEAKSVSWEKEKNNYEASFRLKATEYSVLIDPAGSIQETEEEIRIAALPPAAITYISKHYPGTTIKEAAKITDLNGRVTYEAEVKGKDIIFDESGKFLKEEN